MSNQTIASNLLADLSTEQQQFLVGGQQTTQPPQGQGGCPGGMGSGGMGMGSSGTDQDSWEQNGYDQEGGGAGGSFGSRRRRLRVRLSGYVYLR
ncbi:hypothetical protein [Nostoc parmelioides]|uniref:Uncharacterized protein n=1 Tax=Nostoc parmelioides FACHB-3921 TaxID=2692909 RepID=A0ABR8B9A6_9NOSO|nr:hypothetical protein [Nostoc parmelioides]MBD2250411.1 hypothetical protein [Nostoc parmelioides FACHB-3921]